MLQTNNTAATAPLSGAYRTYLSPQAKRVLAHMRLNGGTSAREAMTDLDITSATLARRIVDLEEAGYFIMRESKRNPVTGKRYTRYSLV